MGYEIAQAGKTVLKYVTTDGILVTLKDSEFLTDRISLLLIEPRERTRTLGTDIFFALITVRFVYLS